MQEYERLCDDPNIRHPEKHMLSTSRRAGAYQGCFAKWKKQRADQKWDLVVQHAPSLAKKHSEVPNSLRAALNITNRKWEGKLSQILCAPIDMEGVMKNKPHWPHCSVFDQTFGIQNACIIIYTKALTV